MRRPRDRAKDDRPAGDAAPLSYSVRICGHCRKPVEPDATGGIRCPRCGRTRGWL